eukprot:NODE_14102_length_1128_cov_9.062937.p2 GENE.NODE_14102_length_1128_cov_9.062937~~NODE_14102_length_1128_cov_9.062937.p2  ORF type:complete len:135 (+),score=33.59 NODE_14102_length_1128_cov_9.062937:96-500(+)
MTSGTMACCAFLIAAFALVCAHDSDGDYEAEWGRELFGLDRQRVCMPYEETTRVVCLWDVDEEECEDKGCCWHSATEKCYRNHDKCVKDHCGEGTTDEAAAVAAVAAPPAASPHGCSCASSSSPRSSSLHSSSC